MRGRTTSELRSTLAAATAGVADSHNKTSPKQAQSVAKRAAFPSACSEIRNGEFIQTLCPLKLAHGSAMHHNRELIWIMTCKPDQASDRGRDEQRRSLMQAWKDFLTTDYGLMSAAVIAFMFVMLGYIGRFVARHVKEDTEAHERELRAKA